MSHLSWNRAHLDAIFKPGDHGNVAVVCGAVEGWGMERKGSQNPFGDSAEAEVWDVTVPTYKFDAVALTGASITVGGVSATIFRRHLKDDGATLELELSEA